jgi:hypothetical protein
MIVIGSTALQLNGVPGVVPNDLDLIATYGEALEFRKKFKAKAFMPINEGKTIFMKNAEGKICEIEIAWSNSRAERLIEFCSSGKVPMAEVSNGSMLDGALVPPLDFLYLLKMSHRYLKNSPAFYKTMRDIKTMRKMGCQIPGEWLDYYNLREKETYTYSHPKLDTTKNDFFDKTKNGIEQKYDHDSLHRAVAIYDRPAYTYYQPDDQEVNCSREMFEKCPEHIKLAGVIEESCVLALERSLVPFPGGKTPEEAFRYALMKVCTSITSGWFREYAWEYHDEAVNLFLNLEQVRSYVELFEDGLLKGLVQLNQEPVMA